MIYTGQTGKLQGGHYGFILDSTLNDFVSGELESAVMLCEEKTPRGLNTDPCVVPVVISNGYE